jgi:hypothetical protein
MFGIEADPDDTRPEPEETPAALRLPPSRSRVTPSATWSSRLRQGIATTMLKVCCFMGTHQIHDAGPKP